MLRTNHHIVRVIAFGSALTMVSIGTAGEFSIDREKSGDIAIRIDGKLFTRYVTSDKVTNKCYFWPVNGPGGVLMTRAFPMQNVQGERQDHPHHRSVCFGLQNSGGFNTWHERLTFMKNGRVKKGSKSKLAKLGRQVHTKIIKAAASGNSAILVVTCDNVTPDGDVYMRQIRTVEFHVAANGSRVMDIEIVLIGVKKSIEVVGKKDSGLSIRVAHSMCVDAGLGGRIVNSQGDTDNKAWGKRALWVDFHGPVGGRTMGVAMLNHPSSFRHSTPWHVRTYGLFTANPFALKEVAGEADQGDFQLAKDERITLRHRLIFHKGDEKQAKIAEVWKAYSQ